MKTASAKIIHEVRKNLKTKEFQFIIQVTFNNGKRVRKSYTTDVYATVEEGKSAMSKGGTKVVELGKRYQKVKDDLARAESIIRTHEYLTPEIFEAKFSIKGGLDNPLDLMRARGVELEKSGNINNGIKHTHAANSLQAFIGIDKTVTFYDITPKWLKDYEKWMVEKGNSRVTVAINLRPLRYIFNQERGKTIKDDVYPFRAKVSEKDKYKIPRNKKRKNKMFLTEEQKNKLINFKTSNPRIQRAVDLWTLSYFCNGLNFADIFRWKYKQLVDDDEGGKKIIQTRHKVAETQEDILEIDIHVREEALAIIHKYGNKTLDPNAYIFPTLKAGMSEKRIVRRIRMHVEHINDALKDVTRKLGLPPVTTYVARHTFATIARRKGATDEQIQEALIHATPEATRHYMGQFEYETKKKLSNLL